MLLADVLLPAQQRARSALIAGYAFGWLLSLALGVWLAVRPARRRAIWCAVLGALLLVAAWRTREAWDPTLWERALLVGVPALEIANALAGYFRGGANRP